MITRPVEMLVVDDNPADIDLMRETLREGRLMNRIHACGDGLQALQFLRREGEFGAAPRPDMILLDLNMPRMDGREFLAEIKGDPTLRRIPVVVLTTSKADEDVYRSYDLGVNSYIVKPVTFEALVDILQTLEKYWFEIVELPPVRE